jgi:hypothetical protein
MNRTVIIVKDRSTYRSIRIHWNYGQPLEDWLRSEHASWASALDLVWLGHRSTIEKPHREAYGLPEHREFTRLRDAKAWCEHITLAYHNGKRWRFYHEQEV